MIFQSKALAGFWECYNALPEEIQRRADKQFALFLANPRHPSLQLKQTGGYWPARVSDSYRALALREDRVFTWIWIGSHAAYDRILNG